MTTFTATYSPEDNKLRLYASERLDGDTYARVKAAGFKWAPKQGLFVAPMWTPARADLLEELAGEIGDEDTSLVERAEERADRFDGYRARRLDDATTAQKAVRAIADHIPFGQPILVGHHSEKRARKDKERIDAGMRKAVKMWETAGYWQARAAGALAHAKYKELPAVRVRRIKKIEADRRQYARAIADGERKLAFWSREGLTVAEAIAFANVCGGGLGVALREDGRTYWSAWDVLQPDGKRYASCPSMSPAEIAEKAKRVYPASIARQQRWLAHFDNRLAYERAMLAEQGASALLDPKPRRALPPLLNYRAAGGAITIPNHYSGRGTITYPQVDMTKAELAKIYTDYKGTRLGPDRAHRFRIAILPGHRSVCVFLTDSKEHPAPSSETPPPAPEPQPTPPPIRAPRPAPAPDPQAAAFEGLKAQLRAGGVQVIAAPQLFPTPHELAERVTLLARVPAGGRVLEPSAGTGALLQALPGVMPFPGRRQTWCEAHAVEINDALARQLEQSGLAGTVHRADFLELEPAELGTFDRVVMNPPFENGADIRHIEHARRFLKPGGRLVAICANGPRQQRALRPLASSWEELPAGTFKSAGTMVSTALLVIDAPAAEAARQPAQGQLALI